MYRILVIVTMSFSLSFASIASAEGSAEFDIGDTGVNNSHDQAVLGATVLYVDILNNGSEKVCWRGSGNVSVYRPNGTTLVGTIGNGQCVNAVSGVTGAYLVDFLSNQVMGAEWDFRVCNSAATNSDCLNVAGNERTGRLWSNMWDFQANTSFANTYSINGSVYAIVPGGAVGHDAVIEMQMRGVSGAYYRLYANSIGPATSAGVRVGRSVPRSGHQVVPEFSLYLNPPEKALYNWIAPSVTDVVITPSCGTGVVLDRASGSIRFGSNVTGQYVVVCDVDKNGIYDFAAATDFSSFGSAAVGVNTVTWNGKNNAGANAAEGSYDCIVRLNVGEFHYVAEDIETSYQGIRTYRVESDKSSRTAINLYWDDRAVSADAENMNNGQQSPLAPPATGLDPGAYATAAAAFYYNGATPMGNARAWGNFDGDGKGNENYLDQFTSADTAQSAPFVIQVISAGGDADSDGLTNTRECDYGSNPQDSDTDGDGVNDGFEASNSSAPDTDGDAIPNLLDIDDDGDGISTAVELGTGENGDGDPADSANTDGQSDGPDYLDTDSDDDGVSDGGDIGRLDPYVCRDADGDGCGDCAITGADGSGGNTYNDGADTNGDGTCNGGAADDDGDGVADGSDSAPLDPAVCSDTDGDTCDDCSVTGANGSGGNPANDGVDTDGDGLCDAGDQDDDNDGRCDGEATVPSVCVAGPDPAPKDASHCGDTDGDTCDDCSVGTFNPNNDGADSDRDGKCDAGDTSPDIRDAGGDGLAEEVDLDDDNDGISTKEETSDPANSDTDGDGKPNYLDDDDDGDGIPTATEVTDEGALGRDVDGDGVPAQLDTDSDNDGIEDRDEPGDPNGDGVPDYLEPEVPRVDDNGDSDRDGIGDAVECPSDPCRDSDEDGTPDLYDEDDDNDGVPTKVEGNETVDRDKDGVPDYLDKDDDGDSIPTKGERTKDGSDIDTDDDGSPDYLDTDDDADGILTKKEPLDTNRDGTPDRLQSPSTPGTLAGGALCSVSPRSHSAPLPATLLWTLAAALGVLVARRRKRGSGNGRANFGLAALFLLLLIGTWAEKTHAQVALDQFKPAPLASDGFALARPEVLSHLGWGVLITVDYANDPLVYEINPGRVKSEQVVVGDHLVGHAALALGLWDRLTLFAAVPVHLVMKGDSNTTVQAPNPDGAGLGDIGVGGRVLLLGAPKSTGALAFEFIARVPTADLADKKQNYSGDAIGSYEPALLVEVRSGPFDVRLRGGVRLREKVGLANLKLGQELVYGLGTRLRIVDPLFFHAEVYGSTFLDKPFGREHSPLEGLAGLKLQAGDFLVGAAAGPGLLRGYGSPDVRVVGQLGLAPVVRVEDKPIDTDNDGLMDRDDACPRDPEDRDGFEDKDGCPDPDNDNDGILDVNDKCPNEPEDKDGFKDEDGCPDPDNDNDGILDVNDKCPNEPEDKDGFEDEDGCPDPDNDNDGILDVNDKCPNDPEDIDGFEDEDGCPEAGSGLVKLTCEKIEVSEAVFFDTGSDRIQVRSYALLDQVTSVLKQAKHIELMRIEGHTDSRGRDSYNLDLSKRRAASVMRYLLDHGVTTERLQSEGYGETRPIAENRNSAGRTKNRRVEFNIVKQSTDCTTK